MQLVFAAAALLVILLAAAGFAAYCGVRLSAKRNREQTDREQMDFLRKYRGK